MLKEHDKDELIGSSKQVSNKKASYAEAQKVC